MPISQPCTTKECQEAALAALRADKEQRQAREGAPKASAGGPAAGGTAGAPAAPTKPGNGPAAAITSAVRAAITSPPGTPASGAGRTAASGTLGRAQGGSGAYSSDGPTSPSGPTSPNRTVRGCLWEPADWQAREGMGTGPPASLVSHRSTRLAVHLQ